MESRLVKLLAELFFPIAAQCTDFQLANLIPERLERPDDVTIPLDFDVVRRIARVLLEVFDRLFATLIHRVQAGIHDEADRAQHFVPEMTEVW
ncbi:MAG: hypothetical protein QOC70_1690 [Verrucomicrobiota bacterium]